MRVVADTNVVVSGLFWTSAPRQVLDAAREGTIELFTSAGLLIELHEVLSRREFNKYLVQAGVEGPELVLGYADLATPVRPAEIGPVILADPDDDEVLACAAAARADFIVSGDSHLLNLGQYETIHIITARDLLTRIAVGD